MNSSPRSCARRLSFILTLGATQSKRKCDLICSIYSEKNYTPRHGNTHFQFQHHCPSRAVVTAQSYWSGCNIFTRKFLVRKLSALKKHETFESFKKLGFWGKKKNILRKGIHSTEWLLAPELII